MLVNYLQFDLEKDEILLEFGGGTGQMADVLLDLNFKGRHIVYDLPEITKLFYSKTRYIYQFYFRWWTNEYYSWYKLPSL